MREVHEHATTELPFGTHEHFKRQDLDEHAELYRQLAQLVWNSKDILAEVQLEVANTP